MWILTIKYVGKLDCDIMHCHTTSCLICVQLDGQFSPMPTISILNYYGVN